MLEELQVGRVVQYFHEVPVHEEMPGEVISVPPVTWKRARTSMLASPGLRHLKKSYKHVDEWCLGICKADGPVKILVEHSFPCVPCTSTKQLGIQGGNLLTSCFLSVVGAPAQQLCCHVSKGTDLSLKRFHPRSQGGGRTLGPCQRPQNL